VRSSREAAGATFATLTPPLAVLASLSCFTLRLKPRKTGEAEPRIARWGAQNEKTVFRKYSHKTISQLLTKLF
jgi:hypothetical protein